MEFASLQLFGTTNEDAELMSDEDALWGLGFTKHRPPLRSVESSRLLHACLHCLFLLVVMAGCERSCEFSLSGGRCFVNTDS